MGTRNLTKVIKDGEIVVAQYGQWDGYPTGQGATGFFAVSNEDVMTRLEANLGLIYYPSQDEMEKLVAPYLDGTMEGFMSYESGKRFGEAYPSLTRDTCTEILYVIADATERVPIRLDIEFENDDTFCEGVYEVNFDTQTYRSWYNGTEVVMTFDEVRELGFREYLTRFGYDEESINNSIDSINRINQVA